MSKLIIFDCDGVLVDSEYLSSKIYAESLTSLGYPITTEETIRKFTGVNVETARQIIFEETGNDISLEKLSSLHSLVLHSLENQLTPLIKPIFTLIDKMKWSCCVASSSTRCHVVRCLELTKQIDFFHDKSLFTSQQVQRGKPAPDLFLFAASQMGFSPKDCLVIEDSPAGIEAALSAGMEVISFLGGGHAAYTWYSEKISSYKVPITRNYEELSAHIKNLY